MDNRKVSSFPPDFSELTCGTRLCFSFADFLCCGSCARRGLSETIRQLADGSALPAVRPENLFLEGGAPLLVAFEHVKAGAGRTQKHSVAGAGAVF